MLRPLAIEKFELREVLFPDAAGNPDTGIAVIVEGGPFPGRAREPELTVGSQRAILVQILDRGARIRGIIRERPQGKDEIVVYYDAEMQGRRRLDDFQIKPLPKGC